MGLDTETLKYALGLAREHGFVELSLKSGDDTFSAVLGEDWEPEALHEAGHLVLAAVDDRSEGVTSKNVGYFREARKPLSVPSEIAPGAVIGEVVALGIAHEVVADAPGRLVELTAKTGDAVEFGQILARIEKL